MEIITNNQLLHKGTRAATIKGNYNYIQLINTRAIDKNQSTKLNMLNMLNNYMEKMKIILSKLYH